MGTQFFDINAKLPIIRAESLEDSILDSIVCNNNNNNNNNINGSIQDNHLLDLPKPSFRLVENFHSKRRRVHSGSSGSKYRKTRDTDSYYHYEEPTANDLLDRVEYDMDEQDEKWLEKFNSTIASTYHYQVSEQDFEKVMDRLEKESFFEKAEVVPEVDEDAVCAICDDGDCHNANVILFCDMCDLAVHQDCYGVPYIPEAQWLCRRCLQSPSVNVSCVLCPNKGGAFKQTDDNRWAHVICALWVPEVCFANTVFLEPIDSIDQIPAARWRLTCYICKQKKNGACIQCHKPNCYVPFHVTCAQQAGLYMKIKTHRYNTADGPLADVKKEAYCDAHNPSEGKSYGGMYSGDDSDDEHIDNKAYKKWKQAKRENMKKTRKILAEKRHTASNPVAEPKLDESKLVEISKLLSLKGKRRQPKHFDSLRKEFIRDIKAYWLERRKSRNGVPLLRRLQVSYNNSGSQVSLKNSDHSRYERLRYDLEKARLLMGQVKKRELLKKRLFRLSKELVESTFQVIDFESPPIETDEEDGTDDSVIK